MSFKTSRRTQKNIKKSSCYVLTPKPRQKIYPLEPRAFYSTFLKNLSLFLKKNGIIIVKIKKGSGELSFFCFSKKEVADDQAKSFNNNIKESKVTVNLRMKKSFSKK